MRRFQAGGLNRDQAETALVPGSIFYLNICFPHEYNPSDKYLVLVGFDADQPLFLKINSRSVLSEQSRRLSEQQFRIRRDRGYPFLPNEISYLDCGTVWYILSKDEVIEQLMANANRIRGKLFGPHENEVVRLTNLSKSIIPHHKTIIAQSLQGE